MGVYENGTPISKTKNWFALITLLFFILFVTSLQSLSSSYLQVSKKIISTYVLVHYTRNTFTEDLDMIKQDIVSSNLILKKSSTNLLQNRTEDAILFSLKSFVLLLKEFQGIVEIKTESLIVDTSVLLIPNECINSKMDRDCAQVRFS